MYVCKHTHTQSHIHTQIRKHIRTAMKTATQSPFVVDITQFLRISDPRMDPFPTPHYYPVHFIITHNAEFWGQHKYFQLFLSSVLAKHWRKTSGLTAAQYPGIVSMEPDLQLLKQGYKHPSLNTHNTHTTHTHTHHKPSNNQWVH